MQFYIAFYQRTNVAESKYHCERKGMGEWHVSEMQTNFRPRD